MTEQTRHSKHVTIALYDDGDVEIEIDGGVTALALYGIAGMLTLQANVKMAEAMTRGPQGGIVLPRGRQ